MEKKRKELIKIIKYIFSSGTSFVIDLLFFTIFNYLLNGVFNTEAIIIATILARTISSLYNYLINSRFVFQSYSKKSIIQYYILVIIQMIISAMSVYFLNKVFSNANATVIKLFIDIIIFIVNYIIQRNFIFKLRGAYEQLD